MPSLDFDATGTPQSIEAALSLTDGQTYVLQNLSTTATLFSRNAATQPATSERAHRYEAGALFVFEADAADASWLWTDDPAGCAVIVSEAV